LSKKARRRKEYFEMYLFTGIKRFILLVIALSLELIADYFDLIVFFVFFFFIRALEIFKVSIVAVSL